MSLLAGRQVRLSTAVLASKIPIFGHEPTKLMPLLYFFVLHSRNQSQRYDV